MSAGTFRYLSQRKNSHGRKGGLFIDIDERGNRDVQDLIDAFPERVEQSLRRTMQDNLKGIQLDVTRRILKRYAVRAGDVKGKIYMKRVGRSELYGTVTIASRQLNLASFSARPTRVGGKRPRKGVSVLVNREIGRYSIPGSFMARLYNTTDKRPRLYVRKDYGTTPYTRFPLMALRGPTAAQMVNEDDAKNVMREVSQRWVKTFKHEMTEGYKHVGKGRK